MKKSFKTPIATGIAICGFVMQVACQAQSAASASAVSPQPRAAISGIPIQTALTELAVNEEPGMGSSTAAAETGTPLPLQPLQLPAPRLLQAQPQPRLLPLLCRSTMTRSSNNSRR
jgi:hypothetical protein